MFASGICNCKNYMLLTIFLLCFLALKINKTRYIVNKKYYYITLCQACSSVLFLKDDIGSLQTTEIPLMKVERDRCDAEYLDKVSEKVQSAANLFNVSVLDMRLRMYLCRPTVNEYIIDKIISPTVKSYAYY